MLLELMYRILGTDYGVLFGVALRRLPAPRKQ